jgi:hypothetical protein
VSKANSRRTLAISRAKAGEMGGGTQTRQRAHNCVADVSLGRMRRRHAVAGVIKQQSGQ